jgi:hypothetical protein
MWYLKIVWRSVIPDGQLAILQRIAGRKKPVWITEWAFE